MMTVGYFLMSRYTNPLGEYVSVCLHGNFSSANSFACSFMDYFCNGIFVWNFGVRKFPQKIRINQKNPSTSKNTFHSHSRNVSLNFYDTYVHQLNANELGPLLLFLFLSFFPLKLPANRGFPPSTMPDLKNTLGAFHVSELFFVFGNEAPAAPGERFYAARMVTSTWFFSMTTRYNQ